jgi:transcriptional regulator with XRE-family HTH domain
MDAMDRLRDAVKASGVKQSHIASLTGMKRSKVNKILSGYQVAALPDFIAIARAIKIDPARLFSEGELVVEVEQLRAAHGHALQIEAILGGYLPVKTVPSDAPVANSTVVSLPKRAQSRSSHPLGAAASSNVELFPEVETKRKRIPRRAWNRGARRIARAVGDSMSGPEGIEDGELVYLLLTRSGKRANGHIVVCRVGLGTDAGDAIYLKKLEIIGRKIRLISINAANHEPIELDGLTTDFAVIGIVVDHSSVR